MKTELAKGSGDGDILAWVQANGKHQREPWEILAWSEYHSKRVPDSDSETLPEFALKVTKLNKAREDINTWFDLVDTDDHVSFGGKA